MCKSMLLAGEIRQAYELLAVCCHNRGNLREAVRYSALLLREDSYLMSTLTLMLRTFSKDEEVMSKGIEGARQVVCLLEDFYDLTSLKDRLFVLRAAMETGCQELIGAVRERFGSEELEVVEQALNR